MKINGKHYSIKQVCSVVLFGLIGIRTKYVNKCLDKRAKRLQKELDTEHLKQAREALLTSDGDPAELERLYKDIEYYSERLREFNVK